MNARAAQAGAVQGDDEERKGDVQNSTSGAPRNQQRSNVPENIGRVGSSTDEQANMVRGSIHQYEIAVLYHPDLEVDLTKAEEKVTKIIKDNGGKIVGTDNWGKRKLAYPINKQEFAVYAFYAVELPAESVRKVEKVLNITDEVIRYLIVRPDLKAIAKAEALKVEKAKKASERGGESEEDSEEETEDEE